MKKWWALGCIVVLGAVVVARAHSVSSRPFSPAATHVAPPSKPQQLIHKKDDAFSQAAAPRMLTIPSLGIISPIRAVGATPDGAMDIPDSLTDADGTTRA